MSRWSIDFEKHPLHETLRQSVEWLDVDTGDIDAEFEEERRRLRKILSNLQEILAGIDPDFFPLALLNQLNQHLRHGNFFQQLQNYSNSPQTAPLRAANDHISQYSPQIYHLAAMSRLPESQKVIRHTEKAFHSLSVVMNDFKIETKEKIGESVGKLSELNGKADELRQRLDLLSSETEAKLSEWQSEFTDKQTERAEEFSTVQIDRENKFENQLSEWRKSIDRQHSEIGAEQAKKLEELLVRFASEGEDIMKDVREKHQSVLEIHRLVGRDSVAGGYQSSAEEEKKQADLWRWISMASLAAAVFWLGFKYWMGFDPTVSGTLNWASIVTATSLTAILLVAAGYASKQSKMHRDNEKQMLSFALETKALDPFMADLEATEQQKIKAELIKRMFGQQHNQTVASSASVDEGTVKSVAAILAQAFSKAVDKA